MSQYPDARFIKSANALHQFPATATSRQFARTSKTPGRTQLVNFFELAEGRRLVDLPGYGFARVTDAMQKHWAELLSGYFQVRQSLSGLLLIVDIRRKLTDFDRRMIAFAEEVELPIHVLLTKADKLKRGQAANAVLDVKKELGERATVQLFSALKRSGEGEAREVLDRFLSAPA